MITLTKKEEKLIVSLQQKKYRRVEGLFFVEGIKMVEEALKSSYHVKYIVSVEEWSNNNTEIKYCDFKTMQRISAFKTAPGIIAIISLPSKKNEVESEITLLAEKIQDPGNLGTIIRTADALGVKKMVCSPECVDHFSPKVVQATMGSIFRMNVEVTDLFQYIEELPTSIPIYAAHLNGDNLYKTEILTPCVLVIGNESQGMSDELTDKVTKKLKIPMKGEAESFNVSIATAIILGEFSRQLSNLN